MQIRDVELEAFVISPAAGACWIIRLVALQHTNLLQKPRDPDLDAKRAIDSTALHRQLRP